MIHEGEGVNDIFNGVVNVNVSKGRAYISRMPMSPQKSRNAIESTLRFIFSMQHVTDVTVQCWLPACPLELGSE